MKNHEFTITISNNILGKSIESLNNISELKIFLRILYLIHQKQNVNIISFNEISTDKIISKLLESNSLIKNQKPKILKKACERLIKEGLMNQKIYTNNITGEKKNVFFLDSFNQENNQTRITDSNTKNLIIFSSYMKIILVC